MEPHFKFSIWADGILLLLVRVHVTSNFLQILYGSCRSITVGDYRRNSKAEALPHRALKFVFYELSTASGDLDKYIHLLRKVWGAGWKDERNEPHQHIRPQVFFSPKDWVKPRCFLQANLKTNLGLEWYQPSSSNLQNLILRAIRPTKTRNLSPQTSRNIHAVNCHFTKSFFVYKAIFGANSWPNKNPSLVGKGEAMGPTAGEQCLKRRCSSCTRFDTFGKIHIFGRRSRMK